ncbi:MAG: phosphoribosylanthranilate isomerase [Bryobacterales bacterium]|nr:phosphoribosylanthranilate isomerase [Bryobacterales bacterium]
MLVKICGVTSLDDALAAVEAGADAIGLNFWPGSPRFVETATARDITAALPASVLKVGVFVDVYSEAIAGEVGLDVIQLHGENGPAPARRFWAGWPVTLPHLSERIRSAGADAFVIDTPAGAQRGGTGGTYDWRLALGLPGRIILAGGLNAENVKEAILAAKPWGVDACSRLESAPGKKDHHKMREFIRAARSAAS